MARIIPFQEKYLDEMASLFAKVFSDKNGPYLPSLAKTRLENDLKTGQEFSFVAIDGNRKCLGCLVCKLEDSSDGKCLNIDTLQVWEKYQKSGVGTKLLTALKQKAKEKGIKTIILFADTSKEFPANWYQKLGFEKTSWVGFVAKVEDLKIP